jgi:hypothetical protein
MKKIYILAIFLIITSIQLYSQRTTDVLYLKNGSIINGTIIEINDNQIKVRAIDKSIFVFKTEEVSKYVKEASGYNGRKNQGLGLALESGFLMGPQNAEYVMPFSFNCLVNYTVFTKNMVGIGSGVEFLGHSFLPLFLEYKRLIFDRKTAPFLFIRGGGVFHGDKNDNKGSYSQYDPVIKYKNGFSATVGTGISWSSNYNETYLSFAYRYFTTSYTQNTLYQPEVTFKNFYNRLEIKFGFKF